MHWPLKIQGRFVTEAEVNEIRRPLNDHPLWNRSRLSSELLRKLDSRTLIKLSPCQCSGPGRLSTIESVEVDRSPISWSLSDIKPVKIVNARNCAEYEKAFNCLVKKYYYLSYGRPVGQNMN